MTFAEAIDPIRTDRILQTISVSYPTVNRWRAGKAWPDGWQIVPLAGLLRISVEQLAQIVFDDVTGGGAIMSRPSLTVAA